MFVLRRNYQYDAFAYHEVDSVLATMSKDMEMKQGKFEMIVG